MASKRFRGGCVRLGLVVLAAAALSGCLGRTARHDVLFHDVDHQRFLERMRDGKTTREDEQELIAQGQKAWSSLRETLRLPDPTREGEVGRQFQALRARDTPLARSLAWAWLLAQTLHPGFDGRNPRFPAPLEEREGESRE
ncbi:MAG: hypothetical protein HY721_22190 [Planctomycetes bacterium]|nr:hypothetical protein [Planctomycetota bacterium]